MNPVSRRKLRRAVAAAGALAVTVAGYAAAPAGAATAGPSVPASISPTPANGTPELVPHTTTADHIRQLAQCGSTMYAVGSFSKIEQNGKIYQRSNAFSFSATAPFTVTSWAPPVSGEVDSIAFNGTNCADAYIGGNFHAVNGTPVKDLAELSTTTGAVVSGFGTTTNGPVETLLGVGGHLLAGGYFTNVNGSNTNPYFASLSPATGKDDGFLHLGLSGFYNYCDTTTGHCTTGSHTYVYNQQLSHGGTLDLVEGDFTSAGGLARQQIFMLNLATTPASVTAWTSPQWDGSAGNLPGGYPYQCETNEAFYVRSAAWSPDDQTVYLATTGFHPWNLPTGKHPRTGLCDAVSAFPATQATVKHTWVEYSGCDSYYSVAADATSVFAAGHPRWADNNNGCNFQGTVGIPDQGLQGLSAANGHVELTGSGTAKYSMSRSANADTMMLGTAGLWIGSTNRFGSRFCDSQGGHAGLCFLPAG